MTAITDASRPAHAGSRRGDRKAHPLRKSVGYLCLAALSVVLGAGAGALNVSASRQASSVGHGRAKPILVFYLTDGAGHAPGPAVNLGTTPAPIAERVAPTKRDGGSRRLFPLSRR
ncbi:MAG: hypothetical protein WDN01_13095 [Rhizomicrobium sp.]